MELIDAHGPNREELKTYNSIITTPVFSVATYLSGNREKMVSFYHSHSVYEFIIPLETIPLMIYDKADYVGEVGYCYPINPYAEHGIEFELDSSMISVVVDKNYLDRLKAEEGKENQLFYTRFLVTKELTQLLEEFRISLNKSIVPKIVKTIINDGLNGIDNRKPKKNYFKKIKSSIFYMTNNYSNPDLSIKEIASQSDYTYTYFTKAFKAYMHDTPINHLNRLRISKAKELMKNPKLSFSEIAKESGFSNISTFTEAFKRIVGMLPKEYRRDYL